MFAGLRKGSIGRKGSKGSISPGRGDEITLTISGPNDLPTYNRSVGPPPQSSVGPPRSPPPSHRTARSPWGRPVGSTRAAGGGGWAAGGGQQQRQPLTPTRTTREVHEDDGQEGAHPARFCALAFAGCVIGFTVEIWQNGWEFQPFWCGTCDDGVQTGGACNEDGTPCEANILLGPAYAAMVRSGGKLDRLIFDEGEWWRVLSCNWLHGGLLHLAMNMFALRNLGVHQQARRAPGSMDHAQSASGDRSSSCGHSPLQQPTRLLRAALRARHVDAEQGLRRAVALVAAPDVADSAACGRPPRCRSSAASARGA